MSKIAILLFIWIGLSFSAYASNPLPYSKRTHAYSGLSTSVRGDTRTVGMSGATLGLADTFLASKDNPAGLAMTLKVGDDNYSHTHIQDEQVQANFDAVDTVNAGLAANFYPWGLSFGYLLPYREDGEYDLTTTPGSPAHLNVTVQELRLGVARYFFEDRLSLGISLNMGQAETAIGFPDTSRLDVAHHAYAFGTTMGASIRLPEQLLLGASVSTPMLYKGSEEANQLSALPGFFQDVETPWIAGVGVGWIPNRFFRGDFSTFAFGTTTGAAQLKDNQSRVGSYWTLQPRIGFAYVFCDIKNLKGTFFAGSYWENSRIDTAPDRVHRTVGMEVKPWIFTLGAISDLAHQYRNQSFLVGVDVFKVMAVLSLIPTDKTPHGGFLPSPFFTSDEGLARPLVDHWRDDGTGIDPIATGLAIPGKIMDAVAPIIESGAPNTKKDTPKVSQ